MAGKGNGWYGQQGPRQRQHEFHSTRPFLRLGQEPIAKRRAVPLKRKDQQSAEDSAEDEEQHRPPSQCKIGSPDFGHTRGPMPALSDRASIRSTVRAKFGATAVGI